MTGGKLQLFWMQQRSCILLTTTPGVPPALSSGVPVLLHRTSSRDNILLGAAAANALFPNPANSHSCLIALLLIQWSRKPNLSLLGDGISPPDNSDQPAHSLANLLPRRSPRRQHASQLFSACRPCRSPPIALSHPPTNSPSRFPLPTANPTVTSFTESTAASSDPLSRTQRRRSSSFLDVPEFNDSKSCLPTTTSFPASPMMAVHPSRHSDSTVTANPSSGDPRLDKQQPNSPADLRRLDAPGLTVVGSPFPRCPNTWW
ncbi:hypothetical protein MLD38_037473 [Melastoma candidum]|uniref:Uncharacterized protein n=1 Tax=Melastoma candidum TaxID=119954 RepID=A0ACB9LP09_9MYRT|nr:hypothetical protein MLD38_037473 [Melastoma candidum]